MSKREKWVHVKVSPGERDAWHNLAAVSGLSLADLIRQELGEARKMDTRPIVRR